MILVDGLAMGNCNDIIIRLIFSDNKCKMIHTHTELTVKQFVNDIRIGESDFDRMLAILNVGDKCGQLIVHKDDVTALM